MSTSIGQTIDDRYRLDQELGRGGMGTVFQATDLRLGKAVALKVLAPQFARDSDAQARFRVEAEAMAGLHHTHIVPVTDFVQRRDLCFLVMELVVGGSFSQLLRSYSERRRSFPEREALELCRQAAEGLAHAHTRGVLHRDIKPDNLLCERVSVGDGSAAWLVKIADFGIAQLRRSGPGAAGRTTAGGFIGTLAYASLEQLEGRSIDERSDIYALGCVLYELLTGTPPLAFAPSDTDQQRFVQALEIQRCGRRTPVIRSRPDLSPTTVSIVEACLACNPADRFAHAATLASEMAKARDSLTPALHTGTVVFPADSAGGKSRPAFSTSNTPLDSPRLRVRSADAPEQRFALTRSGLSIGRSATNHVVLHDPAVSGQHLRVEWDGVGVSVTDLGSTNGSLLNGQPLTPHTPTPWPWHVCLRLGQSWLHLDRPIQSIDARGDSPQNSSKRSQ